MMRHNFSPNELSSMVRCPAIYHNVKSRYRNVEFGRAATQAGRNRVRGVGLDQSLARYPGAFLTIRGSRDFLPQRDAQLLKIAPGTSKEAVLIGGADHVFNVFDPGSEAPQRVLGPDRSLAGALAVADLFEPFH